MKAVVSNGWICCPQCNKKQFPINDTTVIKNLDYQCKACKKEMNIDVEPRAKEPRAS